jgi:hypothetical protein
VAQNAWKRQLALYGKQMAVFVVGLLLLYFLLKQLRRRKFVQ